MKDSDQQYQQDNSGNSKISSTFEAMKDRSIESAGWAYLVADIALAAAAIWRKDPQYAALWGSALWGAGSVAAIKYGHMPSEKQLADLEMNLQKYFNEQGIIIPDSSNLSAHELAKKGGTIESIEDYLYKHPSDALNGIYGLGGGINMYSGYKTGDFGYKVSGGLVATGGLLGILLPEGKSEDQNTQNEVSTGNPVTDAYNWIAEKPLRLSGAAYMANNGFLAKSAWDEVEKIPKTGKYVAVAAYIFANAMLAISSKDHASQSGVGDDVLKALEIESAYVIASHPENLREPILQLTAHHISQQPGISEDENKIYSDMKTKTDELATIMQAAKIPDSNSKPYIIGGSSSQAHIIS